MIRGLKFDKLADVQKDADRQTQLCIKVSKLFGGTRDMWRVSGTFKEGRPEGELKVVFGNKEKALIHFKRGVPHGMYR